MAAEIEVEVEVEVQQPPAPVHRRAPAFCDLHPDEVVTGFCAACLCERLETLEPSAAAPDRRRKSTSSAAAAGLRSLFSLRPELRRCKSFSASRAAAAAAADSSIPSFEPHRSSCDARGRNTLWSLFHQDDRNRRAPAQGVEIEPSIGGGGVEVGRASTELTSEITRVKEEEEEPADERTMKEHIVMDAARARKPPPHPAAKDLKDIAGSFWLAASVFGRKLQKWRRKQKLKKQMNKPAAAADRNLNAAASSRRFRDTQSEVAVDAFGRKSCDIDARFSLDAGRFSLDEPRYSWDAPRASWDGYLMGGGGRSVLSRLPPMLSVVEDDPPAVQRSDGQIPVEEDAWIPGGSAQTRDYYLDSSSQRRRRSLDRSNSSRRVSLDLNEPKRASNARLSPAGASELFYTGNGHKIDRDSRDSSSTSMRDNSSESFRSIGRDPQKEAPVKKPKRWGKAWNFLGFILWRSNGKGGGRGANVVERSFSESWPELRNNGINEKLLRSNSNVSARHSFSCITGGPGTTRRASVENAGHQGKRQGEFTFERNRSSRYSPNHMDNGMLRIYLTPMKNRRSGVSGRGSYCSSESFTRTMLGMY